MVAAFYMHFLLYLDIHVRHAIHVCSVCAMCVVRLFGQCVEWCVPYFVNIIYVVWHSFCDNKYATYTRYVFQIALAAWSTAAAATEPNHRYKLTVACFMWPPRIFIIYFYAHSHHHRTNERAFLDLYVGNTNNMFEFICTTQTNTVQRWLDNNIQFHGIG